MRRFMGKKGRRCSVLGILWLTLLGPAVSAGEEVGVEFVTPRNLQTVLGETEVAFRLVLPEGVSAERLVLRVDGETVVTLEDPPWKTMWDAGNRGKSHSLEAVLYLSDGTKTRTAIHTSALRITHIEEVALVNLYAVVRNGDGSYVNDLTREDFRVTENGRPQKIERFSTERMPLKSAVVLDSSLTMEGSKIEAARKAALSFLNVLVPGDEGMVVTFSDEVRVLQDLTDNRNGLATALESVEAQGGTALYDAIWRSSKQLHQLDGRRVLVLLSDGRDEAANGLEPGSLHTLSEAMDRALRDEVMIFSIGFGRNLNEQLDFYGRRSLQSILEELAESTGGRAIMVRPSRPGRLKKAFELVAEDLRHMYSIAYVSNDGRRDGSWREIQLKTGDGELEVYTRRGYFAPSGKVDPASDTF